MSSDFFRPTSPIKDLGDAALEPEAGDLVTHVADRFGEIAEILPGGAARVTLYSGGKLPDDEFGKFTRTLGVTEARHALTEEKLLLAKVRVRRPALGAQVALRLHPHGVKQGKVVRHLAHGFVELQVNGFSVVRTHGSELLEVDGTPADLSRWPVAYGDPV
jgi:hypothetical protein